MPISTRATKAAATMTTLEGQTVPPVEQTAGAEAGAGSTTAPTVEGHVNPSTPSASASPVPEPVAPTSATPSALAPAGGKDDEEDDDDGYLSDDPDEGIEVHTKGALAAKARVTLTLLIPIELAKEMPAVKPSVKALLVFLRKRLSDKALDGIAFQELFPTYLSKIHFSRLQVTLATVEDVEVVRQHRVEHVVGTTKHHFGWLHPVNRAFVKAKTDLPEGVEVLLKGVPAEITSLIVYESLVVAKLQKRGRPAFLQGAGFHRVVDPVSGLDTDKIRGLVVPHPGDKYRWRHVVEDPLSDVTYLVHYPSLSCCFCQGPHMDKLHDEYVHERRNNISNWNLSLGRVHSINAASLQSAGVVRKILRDPALVLISTGANVEEWLCVQECCERAHGDTFAQAAAHISSFSHGAALGSAGVATRAIKAKQSLHAAKKLYGIRAEKAKGK